MLFIRIDNIGEWKGVEHKSFLGQCEEEYCEGGISCYELKEGAIGYLYNYWKYDVYHTDSENRQITVFEGEYIGRGSSLEDLASCTKTIAVLPASMLFDNIKFFEDCDEGFEYYDEDEEEPIKFDEDKFDIVEKAIFLNLGININ